MYSGSEDSQFLSFLNSLLGALEQAIQKGVLNGRHPEYKYKKGIVSSLKELTCCGQVTDRGGQLPNGIKGLWKSHVEGTVRAQRL